MMMTMLQTDFFKIYTQYINNYNTAVATMTKIKKQKPEFGELLKTISKEKDVKRLDLDSYLIMPIQRIPRHMIGIALAILLSLSSIQVSSPSPGLASVHA